MNSNFRNQLKGGNFEIASTNKSIVSSQSAFKVWSYAFLRAKKKRHPEVPCISIGLLLQVVMRKVYAVAFTDEFVFFIFISYNNSVISCWHLTEVPASAASSRAQFGIVHFFLQGNFLV